MQLKAVRARDLVLVIALMCQPVRGESISLNEQVIHILLRGLRRN